MVQNRPCSFGTILCSQESSQRPTGWPGAASPGPRAATASSGQATAGGKAAGADSGTQTTCLAQDASFGQRWQHPRPVGAGAAGFQHRREAQPSLPVRGPGRWSAGAEGEGSRLSSSSRGGKRLRGALLSHSERCAGAPRGSASPGPERGPAAALPGSSRGSGTGPAGTSREPTRRGGGGPGGRGAAGASHRGHRPPAGGDEPGRRRLRHPQGFPRAAPLHPPGGGAGAATALPKMEGPCPGFVPPGKPPRPRQCVPPLAPPAPPPPPRAAAPLRSAAFRGPGRRISAGTAGRIRTPRQTPQPRAASRSPTPCGPAVREGTGAPPGAGTGAAAAADPYRGAGAGAGAAAPARRSSAPWRGRRRGWPSPAPPGPRGRTLGAPRPGPAAPAGGSGRGMLRLAPAPDAAPQPRAGAAPPAAAAGTPLPSLPPRACPRSAQHPAALLGHSPASSPCSPRFWGSHTHFTMLRSRAKLTRPAPSSAAMHSQHHPDRLPQPQAPQKDTDFPFPSPTSAVREALELLLPRSPSHVSLSHRQQPPPLAGLPPARIPPCPGNRQTTEASPAPRAGAAAPTQR